MRSSFHSESSEVNKTLLPVDADKAAPGPDRGHAGRAAATEGVQDEVPRVTRTADDGPEQGKGQLRWEVRYAFLGRPDQPGDLPDVIPQLAARVGPRVAVLRLPVARARDDLGVEDEVARVLDAVEQVT